MVAIISRASLLAQAAASVSTAFMTTSSCMMTTTIGMLHPIDATSSSSSSSPSSSISTTSTSNDPLLLRVARGETNNVERRPPVWMMRQAGRHMESYRNLIGKYPTFRQRSEIYEVALEISLQPYYKYGVDGVIVFSDILTPLPTMGIDFDITESGSISIEPIRTQEDFQRRLKRMTNYENCVVGKVLRGIREAVGNKATVIGFIGLPYTISTYLVEGKTASTTGFQEMKNLQKNNPQLLHSMLCLLSDNLIDYACYQIEYGGAQLLQVFDSWAGHLNDVEYETFALPYQQRVIQGIKQRFPKIPIIIYMAPAIHSKEGKRIYQLCKSNADIISIDHTVDISTAKDIILQYNNECGTSTTNKVKALQGNFDPQLLRDGSFEEIKVETERILSSMVQESSGSAGERRLQRLGHIMNLGHGILKDTPEEKAAFFVKTVQEYKYY